MIFGLLQQGFGQEFDNSVVEDVQENGVVLSFVKLLINGYFGVVGIVIFIMWVDVFDKIQGEEQKWIVQFVVGVRFVDNEILKVFGDVVVGEFVFDNDVGQDWVCGCYVCVDGQSV